jgi:hypothetical protein
MTVAARPELGDISQVASGRFVRLDDGPEVGVRAVDVRVAGGLHALVLVDRGLDIGPAWVAGFPISWQSPTGVVHPAYFRDDVWLRSFHGGLMFTAGLQNVGNPVTEGGESHGLHGRISNLPARDVRVDIEEADGELAVVVRGTVRETSVYGVDLILHRSLRFPVGRPVVEVRDEVENRAFEPAPVFILYHVNLGSPVVAATSRLVAPAAAAVEGWDDVSRGAQADHASFASPLAGFPVQVFEHRLPEDASDTVVAGIINEEDAATEGIGVVVEYDRRRLPKLWQWRMLAEGRYLTAIEPANCGLLGRVHELEDSDPALLAPGDRRPFGITIRAATGRGVASLARASVPNLATALENS